MPSPATGRGAAQAVSTLVADSTAVKLRHSHIFERAGYGHYVGSPHRPTHHDRAAVVTTAILQILETAPADQRRRAIEDYLRDEMASGAEPAAVPDSSN